MSAETRIDDGGPAFPFGQVSEATGQPINGFFNPGMSLRDWFAGQALIGVESCYGQNNDWQSRAWCDEAAKHCYHIADALIAARKGGDIAAPDYCITCIVRNGTPEHKDYLQARFPSGSSTPATFMFQGHRWRYRHSSFDDDGEFDVLERPTKGGQP